MEGFDLKSLVGSLAGNDPQMLQQMNNMVKMLDDLAENDPEGYKKFIKGNLEQGTEEFKKEKEQMEKNFTVEISPKDYVMTVSFPLVLKKDHLEQEGMVAGLVLEQHKVKRILPETGKILLNIIKIKNHPGDPSSGFLKSAKTGVNGSPVVSIILVVDFAEAEDLQFSKGKWREVLGKCIQKAQVKIVEEMEQIADSLVDPADPMLKKEYSANQPHQKVANIPDRNQEG